MREETPLVGKILVVEDDPILRDVIAAKIRASGLFVLLATNGQEGLDVVEQKKPDAVLLDLLLPVMSGVEVLKRLREKPETKDLPVIILSNYAEPENIESVKQYHVAAYIAKANFFPEDIVAKIKKVLEEKE